MLSRDDAATGAASPPLVSVVIPVYDDVAGLTRCVEALLRQTYPRDRLEVLVVDNNSSLDHSVAVPQDPRFTLLTERRRGSYAARNAGVAAATGTVLAFTDADCVPDEHWVERGVQALTQEPVADMVGGGIELFFRGERPRSGPELYEAHHAFPQRRYVTTLGFAATANMFTWRSTMERIGPFNAALRSNGDAEWGRRVADAGGVQRYCAEALIRHPARASWSDFAAKVRRIGAGRRDADLIKGLGRRYFLSEAAATMGNFARTSVAVWLRPFPRTAVDKLRYLGAYGVARGIHTSIMVRAAMGQRRPGAVEAGHAEVSVPR